MVMVWDAMVSNGRCWSQFAIQYISATNPPRGSGSAGGANADAYLGSDSSLAVSNSVLVSRGQPF